MGNVISRKNSVPLKQGCKVLFKIGDCENVFVAIQNSHGKKFFYTEHGLSAQEILN